MQTKFRVTSVAALAAAALLLGSCGVKTVEVSGRAGAAPSDSTTSTVVPPTTDQDAVSTTLPTAASSSTAPSTSAPETTAPATTAPAGGAERNDASFCAAAAAVGNTGIDQAQHFDLSKSDPHNMLQQFTQSLKAVQAALDQMDRTAPPAIAADVHTMVTSAASITQALESGQDSGQTMRQNLRGLFDSGNSSDLAGKSQAAIRVGTYLQKHCGFTLEGHATN